MAAFWSGSAAAFIEAEVDETVGALARHQVAHFRTTEAAQTPAWRDGIAALKVALQTMARAGFDAVVLLEYPILRLGKRIDAVLLTDRAILVLEFKREQADADALRQAEDYALDLFDFHEHSRRHPVVPVLVTSGSARARNSGFLLSLGAADVHTATPETLGAVLTDLLRRAGTPTVPLDPEQWLRGAYRPVPTIIEAACMAYGRNGVAEIAEARADQKNLRETTAVITDAVAEARHRNEKIALFVTGIPGAGKTLCGLNAAFAGEALRGTFLTGNPTLVHVLREALARDAASRAPLTNKALSLHKFRRDMLSVIQQLPKFRNKYVADVHECPPERLVVIDEAQRCWSRDYAVRKTRDKPIQLTDSEPGHLLDIMGRHDGFAAIICLVGGGQEIHDGEGGLAEWGQALRCRPEWRVLAAPDAALAHDPRRQLGALPGLTDVALLHLDVPVRQIRSTASAAWVDAVLRGDADEALRIADAAGSLVIGGAAGGLRVAGLAGGLRVAGAAETSRIAGLAETSRIAGAAGGVPYYVTRDLTMLRAGLRSLARGTRRAGLLASSGAARLRAEGLGAELPHMDDKAVAHWFLHRFPDDVRASDALEQVATEFSCQGLELDYVGLCWDADLIRSRDGANWIPRRFAGTKWQTIGRTNPEAAANQMNTYRVLLTRARYETLIFVPRGDARDATRDPIVYDGIADFLHRCGAQAWQDHPQPVVAPDVSQWALL